MSRTPDKERLHRIAQVVAAHPEGIRPSEVALALGESRSAIIRALPNLNLDTIGVLLSEDEGKLFIYQK